MFTESEVAYLNTQPLARIATATKTGTPDVAVVGFTFDGEYFYVGGMNNTKTHKYKNVLTNPKVSLVIDDLASVQPWRPRGIKIRGSADLVQRESGYLGPAEYIRIKPDHKRSWGLEE